MRSLILIAFIIPLGICSQGSFAPGAGLVGTTAIHKDSTIFVGWASNCITNRGPQDIAQSGSPIVTLGDDYMATDKSGVNGTVSLGDGGEAILTFDYPIMNGQGWDFAVFENSFDGQFLELAFVEVSSDGINYYRFPATSETQTSSQTASFGNTDPTMVNNLAGKYKAQYGTPFDLEELNGTSGLNVDSITHVKIIDVIGTIDESYATHDQYGAKINDPYPTDFNQGGFDLDAIGVIHQDIEAGLSQNNNFLEIYPTVSSKSVYLKSADVIGHFILYNIDGKVIQQGTFPQSSASINVESLESGIYIIATPKGVRQFVKI